MLQTGAKKVFQMGAAFVTNLSDHLFSGSIPEMPTEFFPGFFGNKVTDYSFAQPGFCIQFFKELIAHLRYPLKGEIHGLHLIRSTTHDEPFIICQYVPLAPAAIDNFR